MERKRRQSAGMVLSQFVARVSLVAILTNCSFDTGSSDSTLDTSGFSISGRILDTGETPVAGCNLILLEENQIFRNSPLPESAFLPRDFASTDAAGQFRFSNLPARQYSILARKNGSSAYQSLALSENMEQISLKLQENGALEGKIPVEFLERDTPVTAKIDELNLTMSIGPDGAFRFDSIPEGRYHLALNIYHGSVDYAKSPLDIEIKSSTTTALSDSVFLPWTATFKADLGDEEMLSNSGIFGLLCADSVIGRTRCLQFEHSELLAGMPLRIFPIEDQIPIELIVFDSLGGRLGHGTTRWLSRNDSLIEILIQ